MSLLRENRDDPSLVVQAARLHGPNLQASRLHYEIVSDEFIATRRFHLGMSVGNREKLLTDTRDKVALGMSKEEIVAFHHDAGLSIVESMGIVGQVYALPLSEAKDLVAAHPVWKKIVDAAEPLHNELEKLANNEANG